MEIVIRILTVIGSMGLFLFGMKLLSEALQKVAGERIRQTMAVMTENPTRRILSGTAITAVIQSSSAVTVMIVSFVNAGIVTLRQAVGLIFGANIGTTATAWLICLFGFNLSIGTIAIPLAGLGFAFILMHRHTYKSVGQMIMGFSLLFLGLDILQATFSDIINSTLLAEWLRAYSSSGYPSIILMIVVGALITAIIQSSSATITLTLVLCQNGWIPVEAGAAMILGENIGTTITANIAAIVADTSAKRAAISHTIINVIGVLWFAPILPYVMMGLGWLAVPYSLAMFHTLFNVANALLLMNFVPQLVKLTTKLFPSGIVESRRHLRVLDSGLLSTSEISVAQAENEIISHSKRILKMFGLVRNMLSETNDEEFAQLYNRIEKYEQITDRVELEIVSYLTEISQSDLSRTMVARVQNMFRMISNLEAISRDNLAIAKIIKRKRAKNLWFDVELRNSINSMFDLVEQAMYIMITNIENPTAERLEKSRQMEERINDLYGELREAQMGSDAESRDYKYVAGMIFAELVRECENIGDSIYATSQISKR